jgi:hypothetical protein
MLNSIRFRIGLFSCIAKSSTPTRTRSRLQLNQPSCLQEWIRKVHVKEKHSHMDFIKKSTFRQKGGPLSGKSGYIVA